MNSADEKYLRRAIEISRLGLANVSPNPHVGAVIVYDGKVIGEGWHRRYGEAHAEVNAVASVAVADRHLLPEATIYVTLEPCSHYGKTPPCAKLLIDKQLKRVVVGTTDPNPKVNGRGIAMLREAGIEVEIATGKLELECREADPTFFFRHNHGRPWVTLKWAQTANQIMGVDADIPLKISTPQTQTLVHKLRSEHDAILTSAATVNADNPRLDCRLWPVDRPKLRVVVDRSGVVSPTAHIVQDPSTLVFSRRLRPEIVAEQIVLFDVPDAEFLNAVIAELSRRGVNSLLVEAGPRMLEAFIEANLCDGARIEQSPSRFDSPHAIKAPNLPRCRYVSTQIVDGHRIIECYNHDLHPKL